MRLSIIKRYIIDDYCDVAIPYMCKDVCFGVLEKSKADYAVCTWYSCRDVFHDDFPLINHIFVCHKNFTGKKVLSFLHDVENQLGIKEKSKYYKTHKTHASLFVLAEFWHDEMYLSLLTLLLRYSVMNKKIKFDLSKKLKCKMLEETLPALQCLFLENKEYIGNKTGWHDLFANVKGSEMHKYFQ